MAKKKYSEPGLNYVIELGMKSAKTPGAVENQLFESASKSLVYKLLTRMTSLAEGHCDYLELYNAKEADFNLSMALDGAYYADFFRKICNWIDAHKNLFHGNVLEIGCGCGIIACFIARMFPEATITGLDRCSGAIRNAELLAQKLNITNINFVCCDLMNYPVDLQYDVVYSSRTIAENTGSQTENLAMDFEELAYLYESRLKDYAQRIACHVKDDGTYISVVKSSLNSLMYGWLKTIEQSGLNLDFNLYEEINSLEVCDDCEYQIFTATKEKKYEYSAHDFFGGAFQAYYKTDLPLYYGNAAKVVYFYKRGKLIEGYEFFDEYGNLIGKVACWTHAYDETGMLFYQSANGICMLQFHDIGEKEDTIKAIRKEISKCKNAGISVKEMTEENSTLQELIEQQTKKRQSEPKPPTRKALKEIVFPNH